MTSPFDTLSAARSLEDAGIAAKQAEAIVRAINSSGEATATKADLETATAQLRGEISAAVNKMLLAQLAIAGLLFAALRLFG